MRHKQKNITMIKKKNHRFACTAILRKRNANKNAIVNTTACNISINTDIRDTYENFTSSQYCSKSPKITKAFPIGPFACRERN